MPPLGVIGEAYIALRSTNTHLASDIKRDVSSATSAVGPELEAAEGKAKGLSAGLGGVAAAAGGLVALVGGATILKGFADAAASANRDSRIIAQQITDTGGAAKVSATQVEELIKQLHLKTGIDREQIGAAEKTLLAFTAVANQGKGMAAIFDRASKASLDISTVMKTDAAGAAKILGKALQDPEKGLTALGRAGVKFTAAETDAIKAAAKHGDTLKAQELILSAVEGRFKGTAEAAASSGTKLKAATEELKISLGQALLPVMKIVNEHLLKLIDKFTNMSPHLQKLIVIIGIGGGALLAFGAILGPLTAAVGAIAGAISLPVLAIAALIAAIVLLFNKNKAFHDFVIEAWARIRQAIAAAIEFTKDTLIPGLIRAVGYLRERFADLQAFVATVWPQIQEAIGHVIAVIQAVIEAFVTVVGAIWDHWGQEILRVVTIIFDQVKNVVETAIRIVRDIITVVLALINGDWGTAWDAIKDIPAAAFDYIKGVVHEALDLILVTLQATLELLKVAWESFWTGAKEFISNAIDAIKGIAESLIDFINSIPGKVEGAASELYNAGVKLVEKIAEGAGSVAHKIWDAIKGGLKTAAGPLGDLIGKAFDVFQTGGVVQGPTGAARLAIVHGGERVLPAGQSPGQAGHGGGGDGTPISVVVNFLGAVPTAAEAFRTGKAAGEGVAAAMRERDIKLAFRTA